MRVKQEPKSSDCLRACSVSEAVPNSDEAASTAAQDSASTSNIHRPEQEFLPKPMPPASSGSWRVFRPWQQEDHSNSQPPAIGPDPRCVIDSYDVATTSNNNQNGDGQFEMNVAKTSRRVSWESYEDDGGNQDRPMDLTTLNRELFRQEVEKSPRAKERQNGVLSGTFQFLENGGVKDYEGGNGILNQPTAFGLDPDTYEAFTNSGLTQGNEHSWKPSSSLRVRTPVPYKPSFSFDLLSQTYLPSTSYHRSGHHLSASGYSARPETRGPTSVIHHHGEYVQGNLNFPPNATAESVPTNRSGQREAPMRPYDRCSCTPLRSGPQQYDRTLSAANASMSTSVNSIAARLHALRRRQCQSYREKYNYIFGLRDDLVPRRSSSRSARKLGLFVDTAKPKTSDLDAQHCLWKAQQIARQICAQTGLQSGHN